MFNIYLSVKFIILFVSFYHLYSLFSFDLIKVLLYNFPVEFSIILFLGGAAIYSLFFLKGRFFYKYIHAQLYLEQWFYYVAFYLVIYSFINFIGFILFFLFCIMLCLIGLDRIFCYHFLNTRDFPSIIWLVYCFVLIFLTFLGFYELIIVRIDYIPVPHYLIDIGPSTPLYPIMNMTTPLIDSMPLNMQMADVYNYVLTYDDKFQVVDAYALANYARQFGQESGVTDHSLVHIANITNWNPVIEELRHDDFALDLSYLQKAVHWTITSECLSHLDKQVVDHMIASGWTMPLLAAFADSQTYHPLLLSTVNKNEFELHWFSSRTIQFLNHLGINFRKRDMRELMLFYQKLEHDIRLITEDPHLMNALAYRLEDTSAFLPPVKNSFSKL